MKEISAKAIMDAYNKKYDRKVTIEEVKNYMQTHAFFNMPAKIAAMIMHEDI